MNFDVSIVAKSNMAKNELLIYKMNYLYIIYNKVYCSENVSISI